MFTISDLTHSLSKQPESLIQAQSIESRIEYELIAGSLIQRFALAGIIPALPRSETVLFNHIYDKIKDGNIAHSFQLPIATAKLFSEFAYDCQVKRIFAEIASTIEERRKLLWRTIMADTGLSIDELNHVTLDTMMALGTTDARYKRLAQYFISHGISGTYAVEIVEAEALWHIAGVLNPCQKIIMIAGTDHVLNLEKYLLTLGFEECAFAGHDFTFARIECDNARYHLQSLLYEEHSSRVLPLDPLDHFCIDLFQDSLKSALQKRANLEGNVVYNEQEYQAHLDWEAKKKVFYSFNPVPLVPCETFKWINEVDQEDIHGHDEVSTKKRHGGHLEDESEPKRRLIEKNND